MSIETLNLPVRGMTCGNCARSVERTLASTPGVTKVLVEFEGGRAVVEFDPSLVTREVLVSAVRDLGYEVPA
jgi:Cu+-exporting ATPase